MRFALVTAILNNCNVAVLTTVSRINDYNVNGVAPTKTPWIGQLISELNVMRVYVYEKNISRRFPFRRIDLGG